MNRYHLKAQWYRFKGTVKKQWGRLTADEVLQAHGELDRLLGMLQKRHADQQVQKA